ncbi:TetR/AcrR family transcriptional regulator [Caldalkalibacillus mannanilyticus]|uniref:TetR/AcrR family transcriptional regulator n=1 Tax=Caldalkalibacillus mannanilyticus TaxID=1418 RepID=UPI000468BD4A|nr:TetR/AcrR family transcriptional regulator [Caldalkalibacillus mannanilyticus]
MNNEGKKRITDAAREIISEQGIQGATIRGIAEGAGLSTGAIYHYYNSKEAILYDIMDEGLNVTKRVAQISIEGKRHLNEIINEIYESMQERFQITPENRLQFYLAHEAMVGNEELQNKFKERYNDWVNRLENIFIHMYDAQPGPSTRAAAAWIIAGVDGIVLQLLLKTNTVDKADVMKVAEYLLKEGMPNFFLFSNKSIKSE